MIDRSEFDLPFEEHKRATKAINRQAWKYTATRPLPVPRRALATLLRALAARLDPATSPAAVEDSAPAPVAP
jgi:hypothetical protein